MNTKSKTALVLYGSPHTDGHTSRILNYVLKFFNSDFKIKIVNAYQKNVKPCIDCKTCKTAETCIYKDMDDIDLLLQKSDLIIVASPVYNASLPSPLKAIFDRMQRYYNAKFTLKINRFLDKSKKAIVILTQGSDNKSHENNISIQIKPMLNLINIREIEFISILNTDQKNLGIDKLDIKIQNQVNNIIDSLKY